MAKTKEMPKPIYPLKHEFYASLDNLLHEATMLLQCVDQALDLNAVESPAMAKILRERSKALHAAMSGDG